MRVVTSYEPPEKSGILPNIAVSTDVGIEVAREFGFPDEYVRLLERANPDRLTSSCSQMQSFAEKHSIDRDELYGAFLVASGRALRSDWREVLAQMKEDNGVDRGTRYPYPEE